MHDLVNLSPTVPVYVYGYVKVWLALDSVDSRSESESDIDGAEGVAGSLTPPG